MFTIRILWADGFDPSVYEQSYLFDSPVKNAQAWALRRARCVSKQFNLPDFHLLLVAVNPDDAWSTLVTNASTVYRQSL